MTTKDILRLDCRLEESKEKIRKALCKIKPLSKYENSDEEIPLEMIEKVVSVLCRKYEVAIQYMMFSYGKDEISWYTLSVKNTKDHSWLDTIYGHTIYETFAKAAILIYSTVRLLQISERGNANED